MELIGLLLIILLTVIILKVLLNIGIFVITLPIKILAFVISTLILVFVLVPIGLVGGLAALIVAPIAILVPLFPLILLGFGIYLLARPGK